MSKHLKKQRKNSEKNFKFFLFMRFYATGRNFTNKKFLFMLIFLNLKSKAIHLFWGVASSLSILCGYYGDEIQKLMINMKSLNQMLNDFFEI